MKDVTKRILIIIAVGVGVYILSLGNGFVWDDEEQIVNSTLVHSLSNLPVFFSGGAFNSGGAAKLAGVYYRPLMTLSFSIIYSISGPSPVLYHFYSMILHITNAILVFLIFKRFFKIDLSTILALVFLVHPLISEVVFYASSVQDALFFFFGSLGFYLFIRVKETISPKLGLAISLAFLASLLSKETGIVLLGATVLYSLLFNKNKRKTKTSFTVTGGAVAVYSIMRFAIAGIFMEKNTVAPIANQNLFVRLITVPKIIVYYLQNLIYPANIVPNQHWIVLTPTLTDFGIPLLIVVMFFTAALIPVFRRNKAYILFMAIFVVGLLAHLNIFPLDVTASGRWFYTSLFGILGMLGALIPGTNRKFIVGASIVISALSVVTFIRSMDWYNGLTLYSHEVKILPNDFNLENNLGVELYRIGKKDEAGVHFQNSVNLSPTWWTNWNNLGAFKEDKGDLATAEADYKKAIDNGNYYLAYENYVGILIKEGKTKEAKDFLENKALPYFPENQKLQLFEQYLLQNKY